MQGIVEKIFDNKGFVIVAWTIALLVVAALILFIYRLAFGRRLKASGGGRTRLPRLGVVDAFDLDRHRQLVIVRRDNIEHLLMIGGPNDLVVESEIIRAESREVRLRDKDVREKEFREKESRETPQPSVQAPPAASWPQAEPAVGRIAASQPYAPRTTAAAPIAPVPELIAEQTALPPDEPAAPPPASPAPPRVPAFPLPPRRAAQPLMPPQRIQREPVSRPDPPMRAEAGGGKAGAFRRTSLATPFMRPSPPRQLSDPGRNAAAPPPTGSSPAGSNPAADATLEPAREALSHEDSGRNAPASDVGRGQAASSGPAPAAEALPALQEDVGARPPEAPLSTPFLAEPAPPADLTPAPRSMTGSADDGLADALDKVRAAKAPAFAGDAASSAPDSLDHSLEEEMARLLGRGP